MRACCRLRRPATTTSGRLCRPPMAACSCLRPASPRAHGTRWKDPDSLFFSRGPAGLRWPDPQRGHPKTSSPFEQALPPTLHLSSAWFMLKAPESIGCSQVVGYLVCDNAIP